VRAIVQLNTGTDMIELAACLDPVRESECLPFPRDRLCCVKSLHMFPAVRKIVAGPHFRLDLQRCRPLREIAIVAPAQVYCALEDFSTNDIPVRHGERVAATQKVCGRLERPNDSYSNIA